MNPLYAAVARRAGRRCEYCHAPQEAFNFAFEVEHVQPVIAGGTDDAENLALACRSCNAFKGSRQNAPDTESSEAVPLYHPRRQEWNAHFLVDPATLEIIARTASGRATITVLRMNTALQRLVRQQWARLSLFP